VGVDAASVVLLLPSVKVGGGIVFGIAAAVVGVDTGVPSAAANETDDADNEEFT
jgi:hypothetical protein